MSDDAGLDDAVLLPERVGGRLALDFVNTVDPRHADERTDYLSSYQALLSWSATTGSGSPSTVASLRARAVQSPRRAREALHRAVAYREALYRVFAAALVGRAVAEEDLALVNAVLRAATEHHVLLPGEYGGVRDGWLPGQHLDVVLWPVAIDAWDLLTEPVLGRVRECPGDGGVCGWLFLDTSRSGTRRWCDMRTCGNRAKARGYYRRQQRRSP